jgi:hypothetical protein
MKIKMIVTALLLSLSLTAAAQMKDSGAAYEVKMTDVRLPTSEVGTIGFKPCGDCDYETRRVNRSTVWEFNGERMSLKDFRLRFNAVDRSINVPVQVLHNFDSNLVTRVWVVTPGTGS